MRGTQAAARVVLSAFGLVLAVGLAEVGFRASQRQDAVPGDDGGWYERYRRLNRTIYQRSADPGLIYEPAPGSSVDMEYGVARFNADGIRDARSLGPGGVAVLGDSLVWGEFLAEEDTVPAQLEDLLDREVLNFGVSGYDTSQEAIWYERAVRPFAPKALVVVFCLNDLMIMSGPFNAHALPEERDRKTAQEAWFEATSPVRRETFDQVAQAREKASFIRLFARAQTLLHQRSFDRGGYNDELTLTFADASRVATMRAAMARLGDAARQDGVRSWLVISPVLEQWSGYRWGAAHESVRKAAEDAGLSVVDPLASWRSSGVRPQDVRIPGDNLHYSPGGAKLLAEAIAGALTAKAR